MKTYTVDIGKEYNLVGGKLECNLMELPFDNQTEWQRPALIVVPGGGYGMVSKREGEPVATAFMAKGFQTFILTYLCQPDGVRYPEQLFELAAAVDYVKTHAKELNVNPDEIFIVGFSAGGHLVGNLAVDYTNVPAKLGRAIQCKPTAVGLCYPVISEKYGHMLSHVNLLSGYTDEAKAEILKDINLDELVNADTVPSFLWATATDQVVPVKNTLAFATALSAHKVDFELHVYPEGVHGLSTANQEINPVGAHLQRISRWVEDCTEFFRRYIKESY